MGQNNAEKVCGIFQKSADPFRSFASATPESAVSSVFISGHRVRKSDGVRFSDGSAFICCQK